MVDLISIIALAWLFVGVCVVGLIVAVDWPMVRYHWGIHYKWWEVPILLLLSAMIFPMVIYWNFKE